MARISATGDAYRAVVHVIYDDGRIDVRYCGPFLTRAAATKAINRRKAKAEYTQQVKDRSEYFASIAHRIEGYIEIASEWGPA